MKVIVPIKRVVDPYVHIPIKPSQTELNTAHLKMAINPFCEIALEEALRLREQGHASTVVAVSIGTETSMEQLRQALALGADAACLIETDTPLVSLSIAKVLCHYVQQEQGDLVLMGKQTIDGDNNQTGQMLATLLGWSQATFASRVEKAPDRICVTRETDQGEQRISLALPAVITTDLRLNEPRFASLPQIMKAKQKKIDRCALASLPVSLKSHQKTRAIYHNQVKKNNQMLTDLDSLVARIHTQLEVK